MRGSNLSYLLKQGVTSVWHNRMMSFASFCILMVSLLLISLALLIAFDIDILIGNVEDRNEVLVFVNGDLSRQEIAHINDVLVSNETFVESVDYRSKEDAWEMYREKMGEEFYVLFDYLDENPMPCTFIVNLSDLSKMEAAIKQFKTIEGVEGVSAQHDFANFLLSVRTTFSIIGSAVLIALITVCLVIVYNTARSSVFSRRMEISIMKHVGATNFFIKFPFFIEGMFIGVIAGAVSWFIVKTAYESIISLFMSDFTIFQTLGFANILPFDDVSWLVLAGNCLCGAILGSIGTVMSMGKHLRV